MLTMALVALRQEADGEEQVLLCHVGYLSLPVVRIWT
jgi:hypothetical protein